MSSFITYDSEATLLGELKAGKVGAFTYLYDQYAPVLLGIITKMLGNEQRSESVLTEAFTTIRLEIAQCPINQPLFLWLFDTARQTAANALAAQRKANPAGLHLAKNGTVTIKKPAAQTTPVIPEPEKRQHMLNAVLFERCTPEEASHNAGLSTETARQQLRQAFLQLRGQVV